MKKTQAPMVDVGAQARIFTPRSADGPPRTSHRRPNMNSTMMTIAVRGSALDAPFANQIVTFDGDDTGPPLRLM